MTGYFLTWIEIALALFSVTIANGIDSQLQENKLYPVRFSVSAST